MPRYFFHLNDGHTALDAEGTELADLNAARQEAVRFSGEVLREGPGDSLGKVNPGSSGLPISLTVKETPSSPCTFQQSRAADRACLGT